MSAVAKLRHRFGVDPILRVLGIAASTYYGWLDQDRDPAVRRRSDTGLLALIAEIHQCSGGTCGSPRVHATLRRRGVRVSRKRVERLMRHAGLQGAYLRRKCWTSSTRQNPAATPAADLVNRDFTATGPDRLWVADATRIPCGQGAFWLAAVRDAFSNRIVGWRCSDRCDTDLTLGALEYAIWTRDVRDGQLVHHSDRGSNCTSFRFSQHLGDHGILASMGSVGNSYDDALTENFFSALKIELVDWKSWRTREEAENALFAYIDGWYNTERIQARLGWLTPAEYEAAWHARQVVLHDHPAPDNAGADPTLAR